MSDPIISGGGKKRSRKSTSSSPRKKTRKNNNLNTKVYPNDALETVLGVSSVTYTDATKKIWAYIRKHKLHKKGAGVWIRVDASLKALVNSKCKSKITTKVKRGKKEDVGKKKYDGKRIHMTALASLVHANISKTKTGGDLSGGGVFHDEPSDDGDDDDDDDDDENDDGNGDGDGDEDEE